MTTFCETHLWREKLSFEIHELFRVYRPQELDHSLRIGRGFAKFCGQLESVLARFLAYNGPRIKRHSALYNRFVKQSCANQIKTLNLSNVSDFQWINEFFDERRYNTIYRIFVQQFILTKIYPRRWNIDLLCSIHFRIWFSWKKISFLILFSISFSFFFFLLIFICAQNIVRMGRHAT